MCSTCQIWVSIGHGIRDNFLLLDADFKLTLEIRTSMDLLAPVYYYAVTDWMRLTAFCTVRSKSCTPRLNRLKPSS